eukprot:15346956-Ditylum_brightwellii.AAC.1
MLLGVLGASQLLAPANDMGNVFISLVAHSAEWVDIHFEYLFPDKVCCYCLFLCRADCRFGLGSELGPSQPLMQFLQIYLRDLPLLFEEFAV